MPDMKVTYYALKPLQVGDELRQPGDLVPEFNDFRYVDMEVNQHRVAPVLVSSLSQDDQDYLTLWEQDKAKADAAAEKAAAKGKTKAQDDEPADDTNRLPAHDELKGVESELPVEDERKSA